MDLDGPFQPAVMGVFQVRIAPTDMSDDDGVFAFKPTEQRVGGIDGIGRGLTLDQNMRRAADRASFAAVKHIAIAAHPGIARPFVSRKANKAAGNIELGRRAD